MAITAQKALAGSTNAQDEKKKNATSALAALGSNTEQKLDTSYAANAGQLGVTSGQAVVGSATQAKPTYDTSYMASAHGELIAAMNEYEA